MNKIKKKSKKNNSKKFIVLTFIIVCFLIEFYFADFPFNLPQSQIIDNNIDCNIECFKDSECNDFLHITKDFCFNAGKCDSKCIFQLCEPKCYSDAECIDNNPLTIESCINAGTCDANCISISCNPQCITNKDCDDKNTLTKDVCVGGGRCSAVCKNLVSCGNNVCEENKEENTCSCPEDCGSCYKDLGGCIENNCVEGTCSQTIKLFCCGNGICETNEDFNNCAKDCKPKKINFELINYNDNETRVRGEKVLIKAKVSADGIDINDAKINVSVYSFSKKITEIARFLLYNDGKHADDLPNDNIYANHFEIEKNLGSLDNTKEYFVKFDLNVKGAERTFLRKLLIEPKLRIDFFTDKQNYKLGDEIKISGILMRKSERLNNPIKVEIYDGQNKLVCNNDINTQNGNFFTMCKTSTIDNNGIWIIVVKAEDEYENFGYLEKRINVTKQENIITLNVAASIDKKEVKRGDKVKVDVNIFDDLGNKVDANIWVEAFDKRQEIKKDENGSYSTEIFIDYSAKLGTNIISIKAMKDENKNIYEGYSKLDLNVKEAKINIEVAEPKEIYRSGDKLNIYVILSYDSQYEKVYVTRAEVIAKIKDKGYLLEEIGRGNYHKEILTSEEDIGEITIEITATDNFGNKGHVKKDVIIFGYSINYYLKKYWLPALLIFIALAIILFEFYLFIRKKFAIEALREEEERTLEIIKTIQNQYFKEASIDRKTYENEIAKHEKRLKEIKEKLSSLEKTKS
ncbi:MAG: hypothetical protein N3D73_02220 [Candidatus Diapherotrites archaeon]|nr:hypothetical protein [Candidatus Diapherotrites archaeon]